MTSESELEERGRRRYRTGKFPSAGVKDCLPYLVTARCATESLTRKPRAETAAPDCFEVN